MHEGEREMNSKASPDPELGRNCFIFCQLSVQKSLLSTIIMASSTEKKKPIAIITIGMAGAGKSTFVQRINSYLHAQDKPPYILNLDPAVTHVPFEANIDIRDTVNYQEVMKQCVTDILLS
jgi:GTPase SAR1 family protein